MGRAIDNKGEQNQEPPTFDRDFQDKLCELFRWRRDVRRFRRDPIPPAVLHELLEAATLAPSVGLSEPWRFVLVEQTRRREAVRESFLEANAEALAGYAGERARLYSMLKLEGLEDAPVHLAVYCDEQTTQGHGLGQQTMPEMLAYSVVAAIQILWLAARAHGVGLGWVSILKPWQITKALEVPESWMLVGYLCLGYPQGESCEPELARAGWEARRTMNHVVIRR